MGILDFIDEHIWFTGLCIVMTCDIIWHAIDVLGIRSKK